jgi:hypothetical protein
MKSYGSLLIGSMILAQSLAQTTAATTTAAKTTPVLPALLPGSKTTQIAASACMLKNGF